MTDLLDNLFNMKYRDSFSYKNQNICVIDIGNNAKIRIERVSPGVGKCYFVNDQDNDIQIPNGITLKETQANLIVQPMLGCYFITWINNHALLQNGVEIVVLETQQQQLLKGADRFNFSTISP